MIDEKGYFNKGHLESLASENIMEMIDKGTAPEKRAALLLIFYTTNHLGHSIDDFTKLTPEQEAGFQRWLASGEAKLE